MPSSDLAGRTAALLSFAAATEERALSQLTELASSQVPGCAAANVTVRRNGEVTAVASSHPEPSRVVEVQLASGRGPLIEAMASGGPVSCPDTLTETRWPEFAATALRIGIRSCVVLTHQGEALVALSLFGLRSRSMDPDELQLAELLAAYGSAIVGAVTEYGDARRLAGQLRDAADSRSVVDQAKGILMHALGCSADDALERMRAVSQRASLQATEVAQRIIDAHTSPADRSRRPPAGSRGRSGTTGAGQQRNAGDAQARLAGLAEPPAAVRSGRA